jgi:hypothetical protein
LVSRRTLRAKPLTGGIALGLFALLAHKTAPIGLFALTGLGRFVNHFEKGRFF